MRFISIIVPAALSLAAGCHAWTQAPSGEWVADNNMYQIAGVWVHESCTVMNRDIVLSSGPCSYFFSGTIVHGQCTQLPAQVVCI